MQLVLSQGGGLSLAPQSIVSQLQLAGGQALSATPQQPTLRLAPSGVGGQGGPMFVELVQLPQQQQLHQLGLGRPAQLVSTVPEQPTGTTMPFSLVPQRLLPQQPQQQRQVLLQAQAAELIKRQRVTAVPAEYAPQLMRLSNPTSTSR